MNERDDIKEPNRKWPIVMVYDVDTTISTDDIPISIARLNEKLGLSEEGAQKIHSIFQRGPRDKQTT